MAITRLKRKDRKNKARANNKQRVIKQLLRTPVIKNVDPEELKAQFGKGAGAGVVSRAKEAISEVAHKVEGVVEAIKDKVEGALHSNEEKSAE